MSESGGPVPSDSVRRDTGSLLGGSRQLRSGLLAAGAALFVALAYFVSPYGTARSPDDAMVGLRFGFVFSLPLLCALWACWGPMKVLWRVPVATVVLAMVVLAAGAKDGMLIVAALAGSGYVAGLLAFALGRRLGGWRLEAPGVGGPRSDSRAVQFSLRYLFVWTTIGAIMLAVGQFVVGNSRDTFTTSDGPLEFVGKLAVFAAVFLMLFLPAFLGFLLLLGDRVRWFVLVLGLPLMICVASPVGAWCLVAIEGVGPGWRTILVLVFGMSVGATLPFLASGGLLRLVGIRAGRGAADA